VFAGRAVVSKPPPTWSARASTAGGRAQQAEPDRVGWARHAGPVKATARRSAMACGQPGPLHHDEISGRDEEQAGE